MTGNALGWSAPIPLPDLDDPAFHSTYPQIAALPDGRFVLAFTRYDAAASSDVLQVISEPSTDTYVSTDDDGIRWSAPERVSDGSAAIDIFPSLYVDDTGETWVIWLTTASGEVRTVEAPLEEPFTPALCPEVSGYTARLSSIGDGLLFGAWVEGADPVQEVVGQFFVR